MAEVVFSEFFSEVPVEKDLFDIFSDLKVDYSLSPAKKLFRLFIKGDRLIRKERIFALEEELEKKAFSDMEERPSPKTTFVTVLRLKASVPSLRTEAGINSSFSSASANTFGHISSTGSESIERGIVSFSGALP